MSTSLPGEAPEHGGLIYVVDDEQIIARTLALIMQKSGYAAEYFSSAEDALDAARSRRPDLFVSDVVLNGMTGIRLAELLETEYPGLPCILISGQADTSRLLDEARARGQRVHVHPKPMQPAVLLQEVARLLAHSGLQRQAA